MFPDEHDDAGGDDDGCDDDDDENGWLQALNLGPKLELHS